MSGNIAHFLHYRFDDNREREINGILPEELVHQILLRMSVKTLLVCKCVCKEWRALIKGPSFVNQHFNHESNQDCLFFRLINLNIFDDENQYAYTRYVDDVRPSRVDNSFIPKFPTDRGARQLLGPENGVFCAVKYFNNIYLLNPATREFRRVPRLPIKADPIRVWPVMGFGFNPTSGDFKVVAFMRSNSYNFAFVYSLSRDSWRTNEDDVNVLDIFDFEECYNNHQIFNGVNYWLGRIADRGVSNSILTFDTRSEKFQEMSIPEDLRNTTWSLRISRYRDLIVVMSYHVDKGADFWVMGREGLWSKSFSIGPFLEVEVWPICMWKKNEVFLGTSSTTLIVYDITTRKVRTLIRKRNPQSSDPIVWDHFIYKESLVSIKRERAH